MDITVSQRPDGGMAVSANLDAAIMATAGPQIMREAISLISQRIADDFIRDHGAEVIAQIPIKAMINRVISKTIEKYGKMLDKENDAPYGR